MKKIILGLVAILLSVSIIPKSLYALNTSISVSPSQITVGDTITVTVGFAQKVGCFDNIKLSYSGGVSYVSGTLSESAWYDTGGNKGISSKTYKFKATKAGTAKFTFTGTGFFDTTADNDLGSANVSKTITIKEKTTTTTTTTNTTKKSSNANLKSMSVNVEGLSPAFSKSKTAYSLNVDEKVTSVKVSAVVEDSKASYSVSGNKDLKVGDNVIKVTVTAEDGTKKVYKINVIKSDDPANTDATLANLIIENVNIGEVDPNNTEYSAGDLKVTSKLNILAYPNSDGAKYEIIGNDKFVKGENKVIVRVTSASGTVKKDYTITFNNTVDPNESNSYTEVDPYVDPYTETSGNDVNNWNADFDKVFEVIKENATIILLYLLALIEFLQVIYLYMQLKKVSPETLVVKRRKSNEKPQ